MTRILLVEDDKSIVDNLTEFLSSEGFSVESVNGQAAALNKIENSQYDLLLVDISLADGNGFAVCAAAKANTDIPVIFLTASGDEYSVVTGLDMGADDYIGKPFRPRAGLAHKKCPAARRQSAVCHRVQRHSGGYGKGNGNEKRCRNIPVGT
jgi:two-component system response regulator RegX3